MPARIGATPALLGAGLGDEQPVGESEPMEEPQDERPKRQNGVLAGAAERDAAGFIEIADGYRDIADAKPQVHALQEELRIEDEVVAVVFERDRLEHLSPAGP